MHYFSILIGAKLALGGVRPICRAEAERTYNRGSIFISPLILEKHQVPAMRLALDFVVYFGMLSLYTTVVLNMNDGPLTTAEGLLTFHITVSWAYG